MTLPRLFTDRSLQHSKYDLALQTPDNIRLAQLPNEQGVKIIFS